MTIGEWIALFGFGVVIFRYFAKIDSIIREVQPNGGKSLKDVVNRLESKTDTQSLSLEDLKKGDQHRVEMLTALGERVAKIEGILTPK